ncbi:unnamed protein product [Durusdinium trenchii]|uniref:Prostaglandin F synthase n=1 Tax=Durusdinium trenchii TaxID=1381693 RepID=A0ABP0HDK7_9DINO
MSPWLGFMALAAAQVTWGPQPMWLSETDDVTNQQRLHELLRQAYFTDYNARHPEHRLANALTVELAEFQQRVPTTPSLALAVAMGKYHFAWYEEDGKEMDVQSVWEAAELLWLSIQFSQCDRPELPMEVFFQRMCHVRWPYAVLLFSELGREFASRYLTEEAANTLERAISSFDAMKRLPYYSQTSWQSPYDMNFNEEWFPSTTTGPVWDKSMVPLAQLVEANFHVFRTELESLSEDQGLFDELSFEHSRVEGQDSWPEGAWRAVHLRQATGGWLSRACDRTPQTCAVLAARPELSCSRAGAALVRLRPGGRLKPHFGPSPHLQLHIPVRADVGARMSVGNRTLSWQTGEALVIDGSFIRQEWHNGVRGEHFVLQVTLCHPCEEAQKPLYGPLACGSRPGLSSPSAAQPVKYQDASTLPVPFAQAALWASALPDLAKCSSISEQCPPDSQHGGPNPLSALNTWNYVMNNLRGALRHTQHGNIDPAVMTAIGQVQEGIQSFLAMPTLEQYGPIIALATQILEALTPWLQQQHPAMVRFSFASGRSGRPFVPADSRNPGSLVFRLSNGIEMPAIGFGTWKLEGEACYRTVLAALQLGLRHIDTAEAYQNEAEIGRAIHDSRISREHLFIATKATSVALGMAEASYLDAILAGQLNALQTEYLDVYMLHAAGVEEEKLQQVWRSMERLVDLGRVRALGVSNFGIQELESLWSFARVKPVYLQNIFKVYKQGEQILSASTQSVMEWAHNHGMTMVGYSTINSWPHLLPPLSDPHVLQIVKAKGRSASQVLHRWALQHGVAVIPKASSLERIRENSLLLDFELSDTQMLALDGLATLSESTHEGLLPRWREDVFGLAGATLPPRFDGFVEAMRDQQCILQPDEVKATRFTLGGGGHGISDCQAACHAQADCGYLVFYERTGFCHMFRSCQQQLPAGDGAVLMTRQ